MDLIKKLSEILEESKIIVLPEEYVYPEKNSEIGVELLKYGEKAGSDELWHSDLYLSEWQSFVV